MRAFKLLLALIVIVIVLVVGVFVYLVNNAGDIVERVVESEGPKITRTDVTLGNADIQLRKGRGELSDLNIANPEGYSSANALHADTLALQIEPRSVMDDVIVVNELLVEGVTITAEQKGLTTNLQELLKSVQQATAGPEQETEQGQSDLRLMVERVRFADSTLRLLTEEHGEYQVDLPSLELNDLGDKERGLTPAELGKAVLEPVFSQARQAAQQRLQEELQGRAEEELKEKAKEKLGDDAERKLQELRGLLN